MIPKGAPLPTLLPRPRPFACFGVPGVDISGAAMDQMKRVMRLPVARSGALMPDAHVGPAMPVGGVVLLDRAVSPGLVGSDIGCRVSVTIIGGIDPERIESRPSEMLAILRAVTRFGKSAAGPSPAARRHPVMDDPLWERLPILRSIRPIAAGQLGESGSGNHFADLLTGRVTAAADWLPLPPGAPFAALMTHSGSREAGARVSSHFRAVAEAETRRRARGIPAECAWLSIDSGDGQAYLAAMSLMSDYAAACHEVIHDAFLEAIGGAALLRIESRHNLAWIRPDGGALHRKGAIPAEKGVAGVIPGSAATPAYLVEGLGDPESLCSAAHGAGRAMSRSEAKAALADADLGPLYTEAGVIVCGVSRDESPLAYKDIGKVMALQEGRLTRTVAIMAPRVAIMGAQNHPRRENS